MKLSDFLNQYGQPLDNARLEVAGITANSRQVRPGYVFVAVPGTVVDGHQYIKSAISAGAIAVVCEQEQDGIRGLGADIVVTPDTHKAIGELASLFYGHPSSKMTLIGVTGTNGKTTIATLLYDMARLFGHKAGLISTVATKIDGVETPSDHTTPDPVSLNAMMADMVEAGCDFCAMEVSSHAADQKRIAGLQFNGGIFTNLTRDHLDYHKTFANYLAAKKSFFDALPPAAFALSNIDDRNGEVMMQNTKARKLTYALQRPADYACRIMEDRLDGMKLMLKRKGMKEEEVDTMFTGRFNAYNLTAVYGACLALGFDPHETLVKLSMLRPVTGRMQTLHSPQGITAVIDYAHTPDAIANALKALDETMRAADGKKSGRIITVFGAGGNRDKGKRPMMAAEACKLSDLIIITSDNPRFENPAEIAAEVLAGVPQDKADIAEVVIERGMAIRRAVELAKRGDVILIAGKGHETTQVIGDQSIHFSDLEETKEALGLIHNS
ncbi:MAG: UDP-N-acetylmuramoyl-L-alanyl-D-glutamate--2,6-diaminopimelate ligase [Clostridium sp.]|nr:UDP-N-acetylmuramoyl-L-alanyl-D-glutamate--2,6-diaminopimelate ligase [Clostridium sp.]